MRIKARFRAVHPGEVGAGLVARLREIYDDNRPSHYAYCANIYLDDPRARDLQDTLVKAGFRPWNSEDGGPRRESIDYSFELEREYDPSDFKDCRYLEFEPKYITKLSAGRGSDGVEELNQGVLRSKESFLVEGSSFFASDRVKRLLEPEGFIGLSFRPTRLLRRVKRGWEVDDLGPEVTWKDHVPPWWEMVAERVMPSLSPSMTLIAGGPESKLVHPPVDPNWIYVPKEGLYTPPEMHYRASDIATAEPFDYARVLEKFSRYLVIVSKRFYDFCQEHELKADWVPVRIDP